MDVVCKGKLGGREEIIPVVLMVIAEHPDVCLEFLVNVFGLPVGLQVVGCRSRSFDPKESVEFPHEIRNEHRPLVMHPLQQKTMELPYVSIVEPCRPFS